MRSRKAKAKIYFEMKAHGNQQLGVPSRIIKPKPEQKLKPKAKSHQPHDGTERE